MQRKSCGCISASQVCTIAYTVFFWCWYNRKPIAPAAEKGIETSCCVEGDIIFLSEHVFGFASCRQQCTPGSSLPRMAGLVSCSAFSCLCIGVGRCKLLGGGGWQGGRVATSLSQRPQKTDCSSNSNKEVIKKSHPPSDLGGSGACSRIILKKRVPFPAT